MWQFENYFLVIFKFAHSQIFKLFFSCLEEKYKNKFF